MGRESERISNGSVPFTASAVPGHESVRKKLVKALTAAARAELLPAIPREDAVRDVRAHLDRTQPREQLLALDQGTPRLHQVVDDDDVAPRRFALFELHQPLVSLPSPWCTPPPPSL
jgi:hypothetical protein